jgi:hypothetical protein
MPRRPVQTEDGVYRSSYGLHVRGKVEKFRNDLLRSRTVRGRTELRGPRRSLERGDGSVAEVLRALGEIARDDARVRETWLRWSIRHRDLVNELGLNDSPTAGEESRTRPMGNPLVAIGFAAFATSLEITLVVFAFPLVLIVVVGLALAGTDLLLISFHPAAIATYFFAVAIGLVGFSWLEFNAQAAKPASGT